MRYTSSNKKNEELSIQLIETFSTLDQITKKVKRNELAFLQAYVDIQKARFEGHIEMTYDVDISDELLVLNLLDRMISRRADIQIVGKYTDPQKALEEIPKLEPDIVFLDIDMPELNGIELGSKLLETVPNKQMEIVFVTAYEQYAVHAFRLNAVDYILKPADAHSVDEVMERIYRKRKIE